MDIDPESGHNEPEMWIRNTFHYNSDGNNMSDIKSKFFAKIAEFFSVNEATLTDATTAANIDGWDSIRHTELILDIEDMFNIELPLMDVQAAGNLGELATVIEKTVERTGKA